MKTNQQLFTSGEFFTGCNYWASHAGTNMWHDWQPDVVEDDLKRLSRDNIKVLRMFPLWSDFQPLRIHYGGGSSEREIRLREDPLPDTEAGRAGVDIVMADRFETFCDLAEKYGIRLIVGLVTGWMSGRMYMPEAFAGKGLLKDPKVLTWQVKYVRYMVARFKNHPAIHAWDLGNECNCMQGVDRDSAYVWAALMTNTIRAEDKTHPVVSGMHSLLPTGAWTPEDQGEILDILCTHPYPIFTPYCGTDPINTFKSILHATAQSVLYENLGGKPCFVEEIGALGPMIGDNQVAADYIRASAFSSWAHDLRGFVWWCANEQSALTHTPYDWNSVERELGVYNLDGSPKPVLSSLNQVQDFADNFPGGKLPARLTDAVCILTGGQDVWAAAFGTYLLAKQANLEITYAWHGDKLPDAPVYIVPSLYGDSSMERHEIYNLLDKVRAGAVLYLSLGETLLSPFEEITGVRIHTRSRRISPDTVKFAGRDYRMNSPLRWETEVTNPAAEVLAFDQKGKPAFTVCPYGKGRVYLLTYPIEIDAGTQAGINYGESAVPYYRFYEAMQLANPAKIAQADSPYLGITEHPAAEGQYIAVLNQTPEEKTFTVTLKAGWEAADFLPLTGGAMEKTAEGFRVTLPNNTGAVVLAKSV